MKSDLETVFVPGNRNYKVYSNVGLTRQVTSRSLTPLDTGARSSFIRKYKYPTHSWKDIRPLKVKACLCNAGNGTINTIRTIDLTVEYGTQTQVITLEVVERLAVDIIFRCDFYGRHVEAIRP